MAAIVAIHEENPDLTAAQKDRDRSILMSLRHQVIRKHIAREKGQILDGNAFRALSQFLLETGDITYETFVQLRTSLPDLSNKYFSAKVFMALGPDPLTLAISSERLVRFIDQDLEMKRLLLDLLGYCLLNSNPDYLTSDQLQAYILQRIPSIDPEQKMVESFYEFYACTAVQKFLFHVDVRNANQINVQQLVRSDALQEFLDLLQHQQQLVALQQEDDLHGDRSEELYLLREKIDLNWFSPTNAVNIYTTFLNLDADENGLLNLDEVSEFNGFSANGLLFTRAAWRRIFEELVVFAPFELDYRGFVALVLALDDIGVGEDCERSAELSEATHALLGSRRHRGLAGIRFFWNVVDGNRTNSLSPMKIQTFLADVEEYLVQAGQVVPSAQAMTVEIYDMLGYKPPPHEAQGQTQGPDFKALLRSKRAATALMMLLDVNSFWRYENRENPGASPTPPPPMPPSAAPHAQGPQSQAKGGELAMEVPGENVYEDDFATEDQDQDAQGPAASGRRSDGGGGGTLLAKMAPIVYDDEDDAYEF